MKCTIERKACAEVKFSFNSLNSMQSWLLVSSWRGLGYLTLLPMDDP